MRRRGERNDEEKLRKWARRIHIEIRTQIKPKFLLLNTALLAPRRSYKNILKRIHLGRLIVEKKYELYISARWQHSHIILAVPDYNTGGKT